MNKYKVTNYDDLDTGKPEITLHSSLDKALKAAEEVHGVDLEKDKRWFRNALASLEEYPNSRAHGVQVNCVFGFGSTVTIAKI